MFYARYLATWLPIWITAYATGWLFADATNALADTVSVPTISPTPDPLAGLVVDYASLAIVASIITKGLTWVYKEFKGQELPGGAKNAVAGLTCLATTIYYLVAVGAFQNFTWQSIPKTAALFAVVVTVAGNLYDKVLHPVAKTIKGDKTPPRRRQADRSGTDKGSADAPEVRKRRDVEEDVDQPAV